MILNYPFENITNYLFDSDEIEIDVISKHVGLKLNQIDVDFTEDFDDDIDFIYDDTKSQFNAGQIEQIYKRLNDETFYASYNNNINGNRGDGILTGTAAGGASVDSGELDLSYDDTRYVDYDADQNASSPQTGCIELKGYKPNYSGNPSSTQILFSISAGQGNSVNSITLLHYSSGQLHLDVIDKDGFGILSINFPAWSPTLDNPYDFSLNYNFTAGSTRLFIDGTQHGSILTQTGTRDSNINLLRIGNRYNGGFTSNFKIDAILIFSTVQHTSNYTPDWSGLYDYDYAGNSVILPEMEHSGDGTIKLFNSFALNYSGSPRILLEIGRSVNKLYWNGSAWVVSNEDYSQATDPSDFITNCTSLPVSGENYGQFTIVFPDSNTQSSVSELTANMNVDIYLTTNPKIKPSTTIRTNDYQDIVATINTSGSDSATFTMEVNGVEKYWTGSAWADSSGYSQSNTFTEIDTNLSTLLSDISDVRWVMYLHSENGTTSPTCELITITYNFSGETPDTINLCEVWWHMAEGNKVYIYLKNDGIKYKNNVLLRREDYNFEIEAPANKYCEVELPDTVNMQLDALGNEQTYIVIYNGKKYEINIPITDEELLFNLLGD